MNLNIDLKFYADGRLTRETGKQLLSLGLKYCPLCSKVLPLSDFSLVKGKTHCHCIDCKRQRGRQDAAKRYYTSLRTGMMEHREAQKRKYVELLGGKCCKCGHGDNDYLGDLTFHHVTPDKKLFDPAFYFDHRQKARSAKEIEVEIDKCALLCFNCHRRLTHEERRGTHKWIFVHRSDFGWDFLGKKTLVNSQAQP